MGRPLKDFYKQHGDEIISMRKNGMMVKDIAQQYSMPIQTISTFLIRNNVRVRRELSELDKQIILERYLNGETPLAISKDYHVTSGKIPEIIKEFGYIPRDRSTSKRQYSIDESFFDQIDDQNKAYILGLLIADGSRSSNSYAITISLQEQDVDILIRINECLKNKRPLKYNELSKKNPNHSNQYRLVFNSVHMCKELEKYGIVPRKDFATFFPKYIAEDLYRHVIRGIMDGDGSISSTECRCNITGNRKLLEFIQNHLETALGIHVSMFVPHKDKNQNIETRCIQIAGRRQVKKYLDYLYTDANLFIDRKYQLYQQIYCCESSILS